MKSKNHMTKILKTFKGHNEIIFKARLRRLALKERISLLSAFGFKTGEIAHYLDTSRSYVCVLKRKLRKECPIEIKGKVFEDLQH